MTPKAFDVIRQEHQALAAMLRSVTLLLGQNRRQHAEPDFAALRAMLFYVDEFPEKRHHKKESELLFPKVRARSPLHRDLMDRLDNDHLRGEARIRELEHTLLGYEMMGESRREPFEAATARYIDFYLAHMRAEETQILPLALQVLTPADWDELDDAFGSNRDLLAGAEPEAEYARLFSRIVNSVPAPVGLGPSRI